MKRINLNKLIKETYNITSFNESKDKKIVTYTDYSSYGNHLWIIINNDKYYFKESTHEEYEILGSLIANAFNIETVKYIPATINYQYGVISNNYKNDNYNYYSCATILDNYFIDNNIFIKEMDLHNNFNNCIDLNNLEIIWQALENKFNNQNIKEIMNELIKRFFLNIIIGNDDFTSINFEFKENKLTHEISFCPSYDYEMIFNFNELAPITISFEDSISNFYEVLDNFFKKSDIKYIYMFKDMLNTLTPNTLKEMINQIETDYNLTFNKKEINIINYTNHYNKLKNIINKYEKRTNYKLDKKM